MSEMVAVQYTCILNLNNTDFYVFSYSPTEKKTEKGFREFSCYINLLYFFFKQSIQEELN